MNSVCSTFDLYGFFGTTGLLGMLLGLKCGMVRGCAREVNLAQVRCVMIFVFAAPPTLVDVCLMALVLQQLIEYY